jgi:hypothetical protein
MQKAPTALRCFQFRREKPTGIAVAESVEMKAGLLSMFLLAGCVNELDVARSRAVSDLSCPATQISIYDAVDGSTVARGCGAWMQYECFSTRSRIICVRESPAQVNGSPPSPAPKPEDQPPRPADVGWPGPS